MIECYDVSPNVSQADSIQRCASSSASVLRATSKISAATVDSAVTAVTVDSAITMKFVIAVLR